MEKFMVEKDMKQRTKQFALDVLNLINQLPSNRIGIIIANQLGRCATSIGANYRAACLGKSKADFIAKLGIVEEEADEACYWLEIVLESKLFTSPEVTRLLKEANEITAIIVASRKTAAKS